MTAPLVIVILPVRNGGADLQKTIDTVLAQTFEDFELIALNNGSTDNTAAVLDRQHDWACAWFRQYEYQMLRLGLCRLRPLVGFVRRVSSEWNVKNRLAR